MHLSKMLLGNPALLEIQIDAKYFNKKQLFIQNSATGFAVFF